MPGLRHDVGLGRARRPAGAGRPAGWRGRGRGVPGRRRRRGAANEDPRPPGQARRHAGHRPERVRGAMNVPWASTRASVVYAVRAMTDPAMATNDGILRTVEIICPRGTVLNPEPPGAVSVRHNTCQRLADTLIRAASQIWPDRAVASSTVAFFGMNLESVSPRTGGPSVMAEVAGGGTGAHRGGDGLDGVDTYMANVGLMPVEVAESS